ncbi:MAG: DUF5691 domain-containing protein [Pseudomonadales bacterium]
MAGSCLVFLLTMSLVACGGPPASSPAGTDGVTPPPDSSSLDYLKPVTPPDEEIGQATDQPLDAPSAEPTEDPNTDTLWAGELEARETAIEHMAERDPQSFTAHLQLLLTDADPEIRLSTVESIIDSQPPDTRYWLEQAALDPNAEVRETALEGLQELFGTTP